MSVDLWGMVNTIVVLNGDDYNADVGNGSGCIKRGEGDDNSAVPPPPPPPPVRISFMDFSMFLT
jgi:hypothetical protein